MISTIQAMVDEEERIETLTRTYEGRVASWNKGGRKHNKVYGYSCNTFDLTTGKRIWTTVPEEARCIQRVYELFLSKKYSMNALIRQINSEGFRTRNGSFWSLNIRRLLKKSIYAGLTWDVNHELMESTVYQPIINVEMWREASNLLKDKQTDFVRGRHPFHLGAGILRCPKCDLPWTKRNLHGTPFYKHRLESSCHGPDIQKVMLYNVVNVIIGEAYTAALLLYSEQAYNKFKTEFEDEHKHVDDDIERFNKLISKKRTEISNFGKAIASGEAIAYSAKQIAILERQIDTLEKDLQAKKQALSFKEQRLEDMVADYSLKNLIKYFDDSTTDTERRIMVKKVITKALTYKNRIEVIYHDGHTRVFEYKAYKSTYLKTGKLVPAFVEYIKSSNLENLPPEQALEDWREAIYVADLVDKNADSF